MKNDQSEWKKDIALIKNTLAGKHGILEETEDKISELADRVEISLNQRTKKEKKII